ncbi:Rossmann-like and DUF2520 domain-containing protein [Caldicellulosiruptoraceae bacterium PP1]
MMTVGFIGSGKAGTSLCYYFKEKGLKISGIYNRDLIRGKSNAEKIDVTFYHELDGLILNSDIIILSISDSAIESFSSELDKFNISNKIVGHLSGVYSHDIIKCNCKGKFSLHPIQTMIGEKSDFDKLSQCYFSLEGDLYGIEAARQILSKIGNRYIELNKENKPIYHAAACIASNYLVGLLYNSYKLYESIGITNEDILNIIKSLSTATLNNFIQNPKNALTGPLAREDYKTLQIHLANITGELKDNYISFLKIMDIFIKDFSDENKIKRYYDFINQLRRDVNNNE